MEPIQLLANTARPLMVPLAVHSLNVRVATFKGETSPNARSQGQAAALPGKSTRTARTCLQPTSLANATASRNLQAAS